jgi:hypothetical protein
MSNFEARRDHLLEEFKNIYKDKVNSIMNQEKYSKFKSPSILKNKEEIYWMRKKLQREIYESTWFVMENIIRLEQIKTLSAFPINVTNGYREELPDE